MSEAAQQLLVQQDTALARSGSEREGGSAFLPPETEDQTSELEFICTGHWRKSDESSEGIQ